MSAFYSIRYDDRVCVMSDAAWFDGAKKLIIVASKVHIFAGLPIAMSVRSLSVTAGLQAIIEALNAIEAQTVDEWLGKARERVLSMPRDGGDHEIIVAAWSESRGGLHLALVTHDRWRTAGVQPYELVEMSQRDFGAGAEITADDLAEIVAADPTSPDFPRLHGADLFEVLRRKPTKWGDTIGHWIGGHLDLTTVSAAGVTMETLTEWPDLEGFPIDPARRWNENLPEFAEWTQ